MGCNESAIDETPPEEPPMSVAERHKSLVEFVRALSEPTIRRPSSELPKTAKQKGHNTISSVDDLSSLQEEYLSRYKMRVYSCLGDPIRQSSTFSMIEDEFYTTYHKQIDRNVLYDLFDIH